MSASTDWFAFLELSRQRLPHLLVSGMADAQEQVVPDAESPQEPLVTPVTLPDYLLEPNAVLLDNCRWRHGQVFCCCYVVVTLALATGNFLTILGPSCLLGEFCFMS